MAVDKRIKYEDKGPVIQGGVQNYLGKQPQVMAPRKWQSAPDKPATELAYITEDEKKLIMKANIHGGLERGPNMGPSGIMSLDSFGDADAGMSGGLSGGDVSAAESGSSFAGANTISNDYGAGLRAGVLAAGGAERLNEPQSFIDQAKAIQQKYGYNPNQGSGLFGNILSGITTLFNPLAGLAMRGFNYLKNNYGPILTAPTLDRGLNPEKYVNNPYPLYNQYQNEWNQKIANDLKNNPEMEIFDLRNTTTTPDKPVVDIIDEDGITDYGFEDVPTTKPDYGFDLDNTYAKVDGLALIQMRNLQKKEAMQQFGGAPLTDKEKQTLDQLRKMDEDFNKIYTLPVTV
jgi:hypothetical protein